MENVTFNNHHQISLAYFDYTINAVLNSVKCSNDLDFFNNISETSESHGCIHFTEAQACEFNNLIV